MRLLAAIKHPTTYALISLTLLALIIFQTTVRLSHFAIPKNTAEIPASIQPMSRISQWHLFGIFDKRYLNLPKTQLSLILEGTIINDKNPKQSYALINNGEKTKLYHVNQTIAGATITKIQHQNIILKNRGILEQLSLPIQKLTANEIH